MKSIVTLAVMAGVIFSGADAAERKKKTKKTDDTVAAGTVVTLNTAADSLSYAAGMVRTDGLIPFLKQNFSVDTAYMADFIRGYRDAMGKGFDEKDSPNGKPAHVAIPQGRVCRTHGLY